MQRRKKVKWITSSKDNTELKDRYDRWAAKYDDDLLEGESDVIHQIWANRVL